MSQDFSNLSPEQKAMLQAMVDDALKRYDTERNPPTKVLTPYESLIDNIDRAVIAFKGEHSSPTDNRIEVEHILLALQLIADLLPHEVPVKDGEQ